MIYPFREQYRSTVRSGTEFNCSVNNFGNEFFLPQYPRNFPMKNLIPIAFKNIYLADWIMKNYILY
jgi:hypothetical protein